MEKYDYLISDVDGILTDGGHYYNLDGKKFKKFGSNDKDAIKRLEELFGLKIIFISSDKIGFDIVKKRIADDWGRKVECLGAKERIDYIKNLPGKKIYVGDGIYDAEIFKKVDLSFCLADSTPQAKKSASFVLDTVSGKNVFSHILFQMEELKKQDDNLKLDNSQRYEKDSIKKSLSDLENIRNSFSNLEKSGFKISEFCEEVANCYNRKNKVVFCGVGKNATLSEMICEFLHPFNVVSITLDPHRAVHGNLGLVEEDDILIILSKSGNTAELIYLLECLQRKMDLKNKFLITSNEKALLRKFNFKKELILPPEKEIAQFSHSPQTTIVLYTGIMMVLINRIAEKKKISERDYLLNHQAGEIGKLFKNG